MNEFAIKKKQIPAVYWVLAACALTAALRIWLPWGDIFANGHINFSSNDSYYQMNIVRQLYAGTLPVGTPYFYAQGIIIFAWLVSFGHLSLSLIECVAVFVPVLFAVGTVVFVYFIGRLLHSHLAGTIAAFTIALLPGEYFARSWLGAIDYHAAEVFLTTGVILFIIIFADRKVFIIWRGAAIAAAAFFTVCYFSIWSGAAGFMPVFAAFAIVALYGKSNHNKILFHISLAIVTIICVGWGFFIFNKVLGISPLIKSWTVETQSGFSDYLVTLHILLACVLSFVYFRFRGNMRLAVVAWAGFLVIATVWQRRFDYYLTIPLALLLGFALDKFYCSIRGWNKEVMLAKDVLPSSESRRTQ